MSIDPSVISWPWLVSAIAALIGAVLLLFGDRLPSLPRLRLFSFPATDSDGEPADRECKAVTVARVTVHGVTYDLTVAEAKALADDLDAITDTSWKAKS